MPAKSGAFERLLATLGQEFVRNGDQLVLVLGGEPIPARLAPFGDSRLSQQGYHRPAPAAPVAGAHAQLSRGAARQSRHRLTHSRDQPGNCRLCLRSTSR